ncbi:MAG TPA: TMEM175 family protein, partial [Streptosporangiaceae bacterium]|nr:TMEM175 family protein [Streptosporangiaceae bacterium]
APVLLTYLMSFAYLGIYWNNHHHMLQATTRVSGLILWANLHLLFWLSLIPFTTEWLGENHFAATPAAGYGIVLLIDALAYFGLQRAIIRDQGSQSVVAIAVGRDIKGKLSPLLYVTGIGLSFVNRWLAVAAYACVALMWLIPDRRLERIITSRPAASHDLTGE